MYMTERGSENLNKAVFPGVGIYGIPELQATQIKTELRGEKGKPTRIEYIPFNYAKGARNRERKSIHFFIDDYQFNRLWSHIDRYVPLLSGFCQVLTPDFSIYTDYPVAMQIYNHYRKHWIGAYLQEKGVDVIPTIAWGDHDSFSWCFDGEPVGGCVAVSSVGTQQSKESRKLFLEGYKEMISRLNPSEILFYGNVPDGCSGNIIQIKSFQERLKEDKKNGRKRISIENR